MKYLWLALLALPSVACTPVSTASGPALVHPNFPYAVSYDDEREKSVMGKDWKLETYRRTEQTSTDSPVELERKEGYEATYEFDFNDDDKTDATAKLPIPDLAFSNRRTNAKLEVTTLLLDATHADKKLQALLSDVVDGGSGTHSLFVGFGRGYKVEKRYASRLLDSQEVTLGEQKGLAATIERTDLDQLQADPKARGRRTRLLLLHAPFAYYATEHAAPLGGDATNTSSSASAAKYHRYEVLLLVEYSNSPEDYAEQYPEFLKLLSKLHVLSDERLLAYLGTQIGRCSGDHSKTSKLSLNVSPIGAVSVGAAAGFDTLCLSSAVGGYSFTATGEPRTVSATYDLSQPVPNPDWLTQSDYKEPPPASEPKPAPPADAAPATTPPAEPTPAPPQPVGGDASSSSTNSPESGSSSSP